MLSCCCSAPASDPPATPHRSRPTRIHPVPAKNGDLVAVTVPPGMKPGQSLLVKHPSIHGLMIEASIPRGHRPGQQFYVKFPPGAGHYSSAGGSEAVLPPSSTAFSSALSACGGSGRRLSSNSITQNNNGDLLTVGKGDGIANNLSKNKNRRHVSKATKGDNFVRYEEGVVGGGGCGRGGGAGGGVVMEDEERDSAVTTKRITNKRQRIKRRSPDDMLLLNKRGLVPVTVPIYGRPGDKIRVRCPDGRTIDAIIPVGMGPYDEFLVKVPGKKQNWHDNPVAVNAPMAFGPFLM